MENFVDAIDRLLAEDPMLIGGSAQLGNTSTLVDQCNRLDYAMARFINAMWTSEATIEILGQNVKGWLINDQHLAANDASSRIAVARELLVRDEIAEAMREGAISQEHATAITNTLRKFPADQQELVEKELVEASRSCDPGSLGRACRDLVNHLGLNESADERYARLYGQRYLRTSTTIDGMTRLDAMLDPVTAAALKAALASLSGKTCADDERTKAQRDHDALGAIIGFALRTGDLPDNGGTAPQVVVTMQLGELIDALDPVRTPTASLDGEPLPPGEIRRLACDAGIIPAVMGGPSEALDLGRSTRTWSKAQRIAAKLRDGDTCTWPGGCSIPIRYCELHHLEFWVEHHGPSNHNNSAHICGFHHWLVHNRNWKLWRDTTGTLQCRRT